MSRLFPETRWGLVKLARDSRSEVAEKALEELWLIYQVPIRKTLQKTCPPSLDPEDLFQDFFLLSRRQQVFQKADHSKGSLRSYLCKALENFLRSKIRYEKSACRDRSREVSIEEVRDDGEFPPDEWDSDRFCRVYDREWARELVESVKETLRVSYQSRGKEDLFLRIFPFLDKLTEEIPEELRSIEDEFSISTENLRVIRSRLKKRFKIAFSEAVRDTTSDEDDWKSENRYLQQVLSDS